MKILIAEDNEDSRNLLMKQLSAYGHEVAAAADGAEALEQALKETPDIIVSDILMPGMDGYQLCHECKQNDKLKDIPFVFYTATYTLDEDKKFALSLGADTFIIKPAEPDAFVQTLSEMFEKAKSGLPPTPQVVPLKPSLYLTEYNKRLVAKLDKKVAELEADITERKKAEKALQKGEKNYKLLFESTLDGMFVLDAETMKVVLANQAAADIYDLNSAEEAIGVNLLDFVPPEEREQVLRIIVKDMFENDLRQVNEFRTITKDGREIWISAVGTRTEYQGKIAGLISFSDITERKQAEEKIRQQSEFLGNVLDSLTYPFYVIDANDYTIKLANPAAKIGDLSEKQTCYALAHKQAKPCRGLDRVCPIAEVKKTKKPVVVEHIHYDEDGNARDIEVHGYPIFDAEGNVVQMIEYCLDIAERKKAEEELREIEAFRSGLLDNSPIPISVINADTSVRYVSPALEKLTGFSADELIGKKAPYPYWPKEGVDKIMKGFKKAMRQGSDRVEKLYQKKSGERFWVEITSTPVSKDGKFQYLLASWVDITERKQAEDALRESEGRYRAVIEGTHDMIQSVGLDGRIIFANKAWLDTLGYTEAELSSLNLFDTIHPDSQAHCQEMFAKVVSGKSLHDIEAAFLTKDGRKILIEGNAAPRYIGGKVVATQGVFRDVTERKQAEEALKESEEKYKTLVEATSDVIWEVDEKGVFTFVSPRIKDVLGYEAEELVGKMRTLDFAPKKEARKWLKRFKEINAKRVSFSGFEITHLHKNGTPVIFETSGIPLFDSEGNFKGFVGINRDVTERRRMQEQLVITDRLASVGELAAGIAHELNNPLTSVLGFSQLLLDKEMPDDIRQDVQVVYSEAQRTAQVVKNLLTFARKHTAVKQMLNINDVIEKVLELRAYEQRVENITVNTRLASDLPEVMADYFQLQQVFLNIIINAEYFMKEAHNKGTLTVTTEQVGNKVRASFADDGPGIGAEDLGHLFDPFFTTKEVGKGTGLGLSICHGVIAEHGGRIDVESELGKGATFIVELPISAADKKGGVG